ncbi:GTPase HflX [Prosthecochloris sp. HL-130-GSB]|uniref:GTPase HflX n=1 Tax=Prosthecochloris aestuarii TaxID=1102 RepID=A0A831WUC2_PROAE|nr:GTPase HflX [Prosthecochloris sp. HL-130-GSB]ARM30669.1 GTPase HflX [Prosthecochloris sp. HL-130-GSB]HED30611.1 GTPase HflX [Prosthecochloris aestuarii]
MNTLLTHSAERERALLVGVSSAPELSRKVVEEYLDELAFLADTAGADVYARVVQDRKVKDPAWFIGKGKVEEMSNLVKGAEIDLVVFDDDLTPVQARNLERVLECKVLDRTELILQIFAIRAKSYQAKLQVELAQLEYLLPRLTRMWTHLSKQKGGIGTKGPGETQIETDRRLVRKRISQLKRKLEEISLQHSTQTKDRTGTPRVALVGYTNAGKSTLMNRLCPSAHAHAEDRLFATLDTRTRRLELEINKVVLLSDTVGFIRKLPHHLVECFRSTLDEVLQADFLLHVIDVSHPLFEEQMQVVRSTLEEIGVNHQNIIDVFNKIDAVEDPATLRDLRGKYPAAVFVSAARGLNIGSLRDATGAYVARDYCERSLRTHVSNYKLVGYLYEHTEVTDKRYIDEDVVITFRVPAKSLKKINARISAFEHSDAYVA